MSTSHEMRRLRARLKESDARFATLMASVVDALIVIDERGSIQAASPSAENIFG
jgi:PAS domain S-box-containing protein